MPSKTEQFAADPIHTHAAAVSDALDRLAPGASPLTAEPTLARARKFVSRLTDLLAVVDPDLLDFSPIPQAVQHLANLPSWIDSYASGSDDSPSIEQHLDVAARVLPVLLAAAPLVANGKASAIVASVKRETDSLFEGVQKQVAGLQARVDASVVAAEGVTAGQAALMAKNTQIEETNQRAATEFRSLLDTEKVAAFDRFHADAEGKLAQLATDSATQTAAAAAASREQNASAESILRRCGHLKKRSRSQPRALAIEFSSGTTVLMLRTSAPRQQTPHVGRRRIRDGRCLCNLGVGGCLKRAGDNVATTGCETRDYCDLRRFGRVPGRSIR